MSLYPWLSVSERSSSAMAAEPGQVPVPEPPKSPAAPPAPPVPAAPPADPDPNDPVAVLRQRIIRELESKPSTTYAVGSLLWEDARDEFGAPWDGAWISLDLETGRLSAELGTYPNQFGASRTDCFSMSAEAYHRLAVKHHFSRELQHFETDADWAGLFDDALRAAVARARAVLDRRNAEKAEANRTKYGVSIPLNRTPKLDLQEVKLWLNQPYGYTRLRVTLSEGGYQMACALSDGKTYDRRADPAEAAWIEERVDAALNDPDGSTWQSLVGGDTLSVTIRRAGEAEALTRSGEPLRKYYDLLSDLERLATYGSK